MNTTKSQYFLDKLSDKEKNLFHTDPKQFRVLYYKKLATIVKQDILELGQIVTPVYEVVHHSDCYDSWRTEHYWYQIRQGYRKNAMKLFKIYCSTVCPCSSSDVADENKFKLESKNKSFFNLLRIVYYYINYSDRKKWHMKDIVPLNIYNNRDIEIVCDDFVSKGKINKTRTELDKQIIKECEKIADKLICKEIKRISDMNKQITMAKAILAKYGTELVKGY